MPSPKGIGSRAGGNLRDDERWPRWGPRAAEIGFGSLLGVPLVAGSEPAASLNLYAVETGCFVGADDLDHAMLFAAHAAMALRAAHQVTASRPLSPRDT